MIKVNCLNPISELGTGLFNDNYEMTDCTYMNPERKAPRNKRKAFPDSGKIYTHRCEAFWKDIEVK